VCEREEESGWGQVRPPRLATRATPTPTPTPTLTPTPTPTPTPKLDAVAGVLVHNAEIENEMVGRYIRK